MAYDDLLARRIQARLGPKPGFQMKKMFGGICYLLHGNMACGVLGEEMIVRLPAGEFEAALAKPHVRVFDITGRSSRGWVMVAAPGLASEADLEAWIAQGVAVAESLPPK